MLVFTVPMRNWNSKYLKLLELILKSFYSTYEELKLVALKLNGSSKSTFLQYLWGIETYIL